MPAAHVHFLFLQVKQRTRWLRCSAGTRKLASAGHARNVGLPRDVCNGVPSSYDTVVEHPVSREPSRGRRCFQVAGAVICCRTVTEQAFDRLTPRQAEVLRLLDEVGSAQLVARRLNLSVNTVNNHLQAAMRVLKAPSSLRAAQLLADHERRLSQSSPGDVSPVAQADAVVVQPPPADGAFRDPRSAGATMREERVAFEVTPPPAASRPSVAPFRRKGDRENGLTTSMRFGWVLLAGLLIVTSVLLTIELGHALTLLHKS